MYGQGKKKGGRNSALIIDGIHVVIGILIVILAVITFLNPEGNQILLPVIFTLAAVLNVVNGIHKYRISGRDTFRKAAAFGQLFIALLLLAVAVVSAISIWR